MEVHGVAESDCPRSTRKESEGDLDCACEACAFLRRRAASAFTDPSLKLRFNAQGRSLPAAADFASALQGSFSNPWKFRRQNFQGLEKQDALLRYAAGMKKTIKRLTLLFVLTRSETRLVAAILAIFAIGLAARYWHLKNEKPVPFTPPGVALAERGE
jgi:hypothetical protein